jgi:uncharacterized protein YndB with AHSA1/START domain
VARNDAHVSATPERVFEVLSDPACYPRWVVGAKRFRAADPGFPAPGTRFHHAVGLGPLEVRDHTQVVAFETPRRVVLKARARPVGTATVTIEVRAEDGGSHVTLLEGPGDAVSRIFFNPLTDPLIRRRNDESLRRLRALVERAPAQRTAAGAS